MTRAAGCPYHHVRELLEETTRPGLRRQGSADTHEQATSGYPYS
ncbi:hypothetical protein OHB07_29545 [Streptomyces sp. NBC_00111]|nr:hypothetical protein [Streptomyces sp. NBC_01460]